MCREGVEGCCHVVAGSVFVSMRNSFVKEGGRGSFILHSNMYQHVGWGGGRYCVGGDGVYMCCCAEGKEILGSSIYFLLAYLYH